MSRPATVAELEPGELAREPRSLAVIAYYDGWGQGMGMPPMDYPRLLTDDEGKHWQEGWDEAKAATTAWASAAGTAARATATRPVPPDGFRDATPRTGRTRWACSTCGVSGYPNGKWMTTHQRGHIPCPDCGRQLTTKLDSTRRQHTRCPNRNS